MTTAPAPDLFALPGTDTPSPTSALPAGQVAVFPAWETLPFERVSPSVETMGQRLELLWRLRDPERRPAVIVTGVRSLLQRLGPEATSTEPIAVHPADVVDPDELVARLVAFGYRREELVELYLAEEMFLCGTAAELVPVREIDDHDLGSPGEITKAVQSKFEDALHGRAPEYSEWLDVIEVPSKVASESS